MKDFDRRGALDKGYDPIFACMRKFILVVVAFVAVCGTLRAESAPRSWYICFRGITFPPGKRICRFKVTVEGAKIAAFPFEIASTGEIDGTSVSGEIRPASGFLASVQELDGHIRIVPTRPPTPIKVQGCVWVTADGENREEVPIRPENVELVPSIDVPYTGKPFRFEETVRVAQIGSVERKLPWRRCITPFTLRRPSRLTGPDEGMEPIRALQAPAGSFLLPLFSDKMIDDGRRTLRSADWLSGPQFEDIGPHVWLFKPTSPVWAADSLFILVLPDTPMTRAAARKGALDELLKETTSAMEFPFSSEKTLRENALRAAEQKRSGVNQTNNSVEAAQIADPMNR